jgi:LmbE family N-acetylglucosaminyl deacetylase
MASDTLRILCFGAHPDDCDFRLGGLALKYADAGHAVCFVSLTNGDAGHHREGGGPLARRRYAEAQAAAAIAGIRYEVVDHPDGTLEPTLPMRLRVIERIRTFRPDLVLCHRANDYHPDHRAVGVLVQDAIYNVTVPNIAPLTPHLREAPVLGYMFDTFTEPTPYQATVAVDTDDVLERKLDMLACHESQVYEWLPYNFGTAETLPADASARRAWLAEWCTAWFADMADAARDSLRTFYGAEHGSQVRTAETVAVSEYGTPLNEESIPRLFPFLPRR